MWRKKKDGGGGDKKASASTTDAGNDSKTALSANEKYEFRDTVLKYTRKNNGAYVDFDKFCNDLSKKYSGKIDALIDYIDNLESKAGSEGRQLMLMYIKQRLQNKNKNNIKAYKNVKAEPKKDDFVSKVESKATDILKEAGINDVKKVAKVSTMGDVITISYINMSDVRVGVDFAKTGKISGNVRGNHARESNIIAEIVQNNSKTSKTSDKRD